MTVAGIDDDLYGRLIHAEVQGTILTAQELHNQVGTIHSVPLLPNTNGIQNPAPTYKIRHKSSGIIYVISADQSKRLPRDSIVDFIANSKVDTTRSRSSKDSKDSSRHTTSSTDLTISSTVDQILLMMRTATDFDVISEKFSQLYGRIYSQGTPLDRTDALICLMPHLKEMSLCLTAPKWDMTESKATICQATIVLHLLNMFISFPISRCKIQRSSGELPNAVGRMILMYPQF